MKGTPFYLSVLTLLLLGSCSSISNQNQLIIIKKKLKIWN